MQLNFNPRLLLITGLLLMIFTAKAQSPQKIGKVDEADLQMTVYEKDSSAAAVILFDKAEIEFDFNQGTDAYVFTRHRRIKILKRSAFDYGDVELSYYTDGEKLNNIKAIIHNPDGSSEKLKNKDIFREAYDENWSLVKFSFPDLQEGSIIEYEYELYSPYIASLPEWFFQYDIPVRWSEYNIEVPQWYSYTGISQGRPIDIKEQTAGKKMFMISISGGTSASQRGSTTLEVSQTHLVMKDIPAITEESYITNMDDYRARVRYQLQSTTINGRYKPYMTDWNDLATRLLEHPYFGEQLNKKKYFKAISKELEPLLAEAETETEKAKIIYDHINETMQWNEQFGIYIDTDLEEAYERKRARAGEINLLLLGTLLQENIKAYPVLVSTRSHGKMLELYPILNQFNHVMVVAELDGKEMVLDQGNTCRPMGMARPAALNGNMAMLLQQNNSQWIRLPQPAAKSVQMAQVTMDEEGGISGKLAEMRQGYSAVFMRNALELTEAEDLYKESYTEDMPDINIAKVSVSEEADMSKSFKSEIEFTLPNTAMVNGDFIYFSPIFSQGFEENPFKLEKREYPVDFNYPMSERFVLVMELPEGFVLEETPEAANISLAERGATFNYSVQQIGTKINLSYTLEINKTVFQPEEYESLKKFFDLVIEKQSEQLVLRYNE